MFILLNILPGTEKRNQGVFVWEILNRKSKTSLLLFLPRQKNLLRMHVADRLLPAQRNTSISWNISRKASCLQSRIRFSLETDSSED